MRAIELLHALSASMHDAYAGDCLNHARRLVAELRAEGREAWLGRLRWTEQRGSATVHHPLIPLRYRNRGLATVPSWTTHYVACCEGEAWDPLVGEPVALDGYAAATFGRPLEVERAE